MLGRGVAFLSALLRGKLVALYLYFLRREAAADEPGHVCDLGKHIGPDACSGTWGGIGSGRVGVTPPPPRLVLRENRPLPSGTSSINT